MRSKQGANRSKQNTMQPPGFRRALQEKRSAAVISLHLQNIIKTITCLGLYIYFPGHSPELVADWHPAAALCRRATNHSSSIPAPSTLPERAPFLNPREAASQTAANPNSRSEPHFLSTPIPSPHLPHLLPRWNDCNGLARIASAVQVSNLLIRKALRDALEGIMSCQCRAIK